MKIGRLHETGQESERLGMDNKRQNGLLANERRRQTFVTVAMLVIVGAGLFGGNVARGLFVPSDIVAAVQAGQNGQGGMHGSGHPGGAIVRFALAPHLGSDLGLPGHRHRHIAGHGGAPGQDGQTTVQDTMIAPENILHGPGSDNEQLALNMPGIEGLGRGIPGLNPGSNGSSGGGSSGGVDPGLAGPITAGSDINPYTNTPTAPLPEPETWVMMALGLAFSGWAARRHRRSADGLATA